MSKGGSSGTADSIGMGLGAGVEVLEVEAALLGVMEEAAWPPGVTTAHSVMRWVWSIASSN